MIIKLLFVAMVLSLLSLLGVAIAVFVRVWTHLKGRTKPPAEVKHPVETTSGQS